MTCGRLPVVLILTAAMPAWGAYQSLTVPASASVKLTTPAVAPFTSMGDFRLAMRLHDWTVPTSGSVPIFNSVNTNIRVALFPNSILCSAIYGNDQANQYSNWQCADVTGLNDIVLRYQRFGNTYPSDGVGAAMGSLLMEVQNGVTGQMLPPAHCQYNSVSGNQFACPIKTPANTPENGTSTFGGGGQFSMAWLKWSSVTVPPGSAMEQETSTADLADFRFEGNYSNQGTGGYAVTMAANSGSPSFTGSAVHPPLCYLQSQVFRAGNPAQIANYSYALNGGPLTSQWQQLSGPTRLKWSSQSAAQPTVTGGVFGSYVLQLALTDSSGSRSTCTVKDGFVASDGNGVVTSANPMVDVLLGPQIQLGKNPWSWFDDRHVAEGVIQAANLQPGVYYGNDYWNVPGAGTITLTNNSATVTGVGTSFTTTFCQGPGNPTTAKTGAEIIVWYPLAGVPGGTGRRVAQVYSCQSDTQLTLSNPQHSAAQPWSPTNDIAGGTGLHYTYSDGTLDALWISNSYAPDFYDAVAGLYALYYRSGIDDYLTAARTLADNFWVRRLDSGRNYFTDEGNSTFPRNRSVLGMVLRALDGRPDMWAGLELIFKFDIYQSHAFIQAYGPWKRNTIAANSDPRETGYQIASIANCALADTANPTQQASCRAELAELVNSGLTPARNPDGNWYTLYVQNASWLNNTSVTLSNSSATVTCNGACNWTPSLFTWELNGGYYPPAWWFTGNPAGAPLNNSDGDPITYYPVYVDANHATLRDMSGAQVNYQGAGCTPTCTRGWATGGGQVGFGVQPYMLGILATALDFVSKAMACTSAGVPANCDNTVSTTAKSYNVAMGRYLQSTGYWPARKAMYYATGFVNCQAPIADNNPGCTDLNDANAARTLSTEAMRGVMTAYSNSGDPVLQSFGDTLYTAMWGKPGFTVAPGQASDGAYLWGYNNGLGGYMVGVPPNGQHHKYFGMAFGIGAGSAWPGYRLGGAHTGPMVEASIGVDFASVPNAAKANLLITYPTGANATAACAASPCKVSFDKTLGIPLVRVQYLSSSGAVLSTQTEASPVY